MTDRVKFTIFYGMEDEEEIPSGTFPDTREEADEQENAEQVARLDAAWQAVPPCPPPGPPDWIPPGGEVFGIPLAGEFGIPLAGEETAIRRLNGYMTGQYAADPVERNCAVTVDGYVRQEKYDESVNEFNNPKAEVDRPESFLSTVSSRDDETMTI